MRRPRPIRRLLDGRPDDPGRRIVRRATALLIAATLTSNVVGALVVFALAGFVLPTPELEDPDRVLLINLVAAGIYVVLALIAGTAIGLGRLRATRAWLVEDRAPTEAERRATLRTPARVLTVDAALWGLAAVLFLALNARWSWSLGVTVGLTVLLGGVTTCASAYLMAERITRAASARALSHGVPDRPVLPGVTSRALLAWALGSGVPTLGLALVAIVDLAGRDVDPDELAITAVALGGVALVVGLVVTWQAARAIADPVLSVREALRRVERGDLDTEVPVFDGSELGLLQAGFNRMGAGLREREQLRDLFGRHVGEDVARAATERGIELGGEEREVAVLFVDLAGSTELAARRPPQEVVSLLNRFFGVVVDVVERHGGWINKFEGDAALAVFGVPLPREDAAACALAAARELAERLPEEVPELRAGIGVSAGPAVAGNIGAESRFEYTVIGDPVNEAARLCELAKSDGARVLAAEGALERAGEAEAARWRRGEPVHLRGHEAPTTPAAPVA